MIPLWIFYINYLCKAKYFLMFSFAFFPLLQRKEVMVRVVEKIIIKGGK